MALSRLMAFRVFEQDAADIELMVQSKGFPCVSEYLRNVVYNDLGKPVPMRDISSIPFMQPKKKRVIDEEEFTELNEREKKLNQIIKT
jgi:hypothetical protein